MVDQEEPTTAKRSPCGDVDHRSQSLPGVEEEEGHGEEVGEGVLR